MPGGGRWNRTKEIKAPEQVNVWVEHESRHDSRMRSGSGECHEENPYC